MVELRRAIIQSEISTTCLNDCRHSEKVKPHLGASYVLILKSELMRILTVKYIVF